MLKNDKRMWIGIFVLIIIEQLIKIVINHSYLHKNIPILPPILYFKPIFNRDYSWFNSMLQLGVSKWLHIAVVAVMIIFIYLFYRHIKRRMEGHRLIKIMFAFIFSGAMCSLIDKVFWNGSLDYILVNGFFTFDLKDVYVNVFVGLLILFMIINKSPLNNNAE